MPLTFERSPDTDAVIIVLRGVNQEISYADIARQAGLSVARAKQVMSSARRTLRNDKILFGVIRSYGLKRLSDTEKVAKSEDNKKKMSRTAGRALKELDTIQEPERLPAREQLMATTNRTIFSLMKIHARMQPKEVQPTKQANQPDVTNLVKMAKAKAK